MNSQFRYFIYCRKSSEDSHRQIASINDQIDALKKIAERESLFLMRTPFIEERSAKDPGRPIFNEMLKKIHHGEANALFCWDIDRLSRNPIDNGQLQWMLQKGVIKVIKTPSRCFYPEDAGLLMSIEGGRATDYVMKLAKNVQRGMHGRAIKGWRPNLAPIGYLNDGYEKGNKTIIPDPERFDIIRKMWDLLLTGGYSISKIRTIATNEWGLRTRKRRRIGGNPIAKNQLYNLFRDSFYYGYFQWKDLETGEYKMIKGNHPIMITEKEYWQAQVILGKKGKPQPQTREFAYTGLIKCGECNSSITAEVKQQVICSVCKFKFSHVNKTQCPKCRTDISEMNNPKILYYTYYHCTKKKNHHCTQKSVKLEDLESQILNFLEVITLDTDMLKNVDAYAIRVQENAPKEEITIKDSLKSAYNDSQKRLYNLKRGFLSIMNSNFELFTEHEFLEQKKIILSECDAIQSKMNNSKVTSKDTLLMLKNIINFCVEAKERFQNGNLITKRIILNTLGSNLKLIQKKLYIERAFPYINIENTLSQQNAKNDRLEPEYNLDLQEPNATYLMSFSFWCSTFDTIRKWIEENETFVVPKFNKEVDTS